MDETNFFQPAFFLFTLCTNGAAFNRGPWPLELACGDGLLDLALVGQPSIFLARSLAVGLAGLSLCGLLLSTLSVSSASSITLTTALAPRQPCYLSWEVPHIDSREMNLEMEHLQHRVQAGVKLWIVLEQKKCWMKVKISAHGMDGSDGLDPNRELVFLGFVDAELWQLWPQ